MIPLSKKWAMMIDLTNRCIHRCNYCCKMVQHTRVDQWNQMSLTDLVRALDSLRLRYPDGWPGRVCVTGGEPLLHSQFSECCRIIQDYVPRHRAGIFTTSRSLSEKYDDEIRKTFSMYFLNEHTDAQKAICLHQPMTIAIGDMVTDEKLRRELIEDCWLWRMWSPVMTPKGGFACDCMAGLDYVLDGPGGYPLEPYWWNKSAEDCSDQINRYCNDCGMALPYPQQIQAAEKQIFSRGLYNKLIQHGLPHLEPEHVILLDRPLTREEIESNRKGWEPWHNRQDRGSGGEGVEKYL